jgi:hypothetical protein
LPIRGPDASTPYVDLGVPASGLSAPIDIDTLFCRPGSRAAAEHAGRFRVRHDGLKGRVSDHEHGPSPQTDRASSNVVRETTGRAQ